MNIITPRDAPLHIAANDETAILAPASGNVVILVCTHCGNMKQAHVMLLPGQTYEEHQRNIQLFKEIARCMCVPLAYRSKGDADG